MTLLVFNINGKTTQEKESTNIDFPEIINTRMQNFEKCLQTIWCFFKMSLTRN